MSMYHHSECIFLSIQVLFHEMRAIQKACHELEEGYQPAVTFIVAVKRHHGRFNILSREDGVNCSFLLNFLFINFFAKTKQNKKNLDIISWVRFSCLFSGLLSLFEIKEKIKRENEKSQNNY